MVSIGRKNLKVSKERALELIAQKISQFDSVLSKATYENRYNEDYDLAYYGTETLLTELFSKDEAMNFRRSVSPMIVAVGGRIDYAKELRDYKNHIQSCISQLKVYQERVADFWVEDGKVQTKRISIVPFVSMSFDERDKK